MKIDKTIEGLFKIEYHKACKKWPHFPIDKIYAAAIVSEEAGELMRSTLQCFFEGGDKESMQKEALHTMVTAYRFLENL